jgi:hypothetical protein
VSCGDVDCRAFLLDKMFQTCLGYGEEKGGGVGAGGRAGVGGRGISGDDGGPGGRESREGWRCLADESDECEMLCSFPKGKGCGKGRRDCK